MSQRHFIVATAGHVDHGKSAVVQALTGTNPDRLPEEKARGITIDLGFAHLTLPAPDRRELSLGIIDVPGHFDFIKNMVAGVGAVDLALLVVAADDGWMPQTEEHLQILEYLGVRRALVVLTKADRVDPPRVEEQVGDLRARLAGTGLADAPCVVTSTVDGRGWDAVRAGLVAQLAGAATAADLGRPRLWIDRAFTLRGIGRVVTGTLTGGGWRVGDPVVVAGRGLGGRIRSLQHHGQPAAEAFPGTRTALQVVIDERQGAAADDWGRGDLLTTAACAEVGSACDVWLTISPRAMDGAAGRPLLRHGVRARLHTGTAAVDCRVILPGGGVLVPGESGLAQLRLARPLALVERDRFVLRDAAERRTIAGGFILDPLAPRHGFHRSGRQRYLAAVATADDARARLRARIQHDPFLSWELLARRGAHAPSAIAEALAYLEKQGEAVRVGGLVAETQAWERLVASAAAAIRRHHAQHPTQNGLPLPQLAGRAGAPRAVAGLMDAVVAELGRRGFETVGAAIRAVEHRPVLPVSLEPAARRLRATLAQAGLNPPTRSALAPTAALADALQFLLKTGEVIALSPDIVVAAASWAEAKAAVRDILRRGPATVTELKVALGTTRRVAVPLLERLDREGVTRREGERRCLPEPAPFAAPTL